MVCSSEFLWPMRIGERSFPKDYPLVFPPLRLPPVHSSPTHDGQAPPYSDYPLRLMHFKVVAHPFFHLIADDYPVDGAAAVPTNKRSQHCYFEREILYIKKRPCLLGDWCLNGHRCRLRRKQTSLMMQQRPPEASHWPHCAVWRERFSPFFLWVCLFCVHFLLTVVYRWGSLDVCLSI